MVGGYVTLTMMTSFGLHYWLAILVSVIVAGLLGVLMERVVFHPLREAPPIHDKIAAIGILLFLQALAKLIWGADFQTMPSSNRHVWRLVSLPSSLTTIFIIICTIPV